MTIRILGSTVKRLVSWLLISRRFEGDQNRFCARVSAAYSSRGDSFDAVLQHGMRWIFQRSIDFDSARSVEGRACKALARRTKVSGC